MTPPTRDELLEFYLSLSSTSDLKRAIDSWVYGFRDDQDGCPECGPETVCRCRENAKHERADWESECVREEREAA